MFRSKKNSVALIKKKKLISTINSNITSMIKKDAFRKSDFISKFHNKNAISIDIDY